MKKGDRVIANGGQHGRITLIGKTMLGVTFDGDVYENYFAPEELQPELTEAAPAFVKGDRVIVHCGANVDKHGRVFDTLSLCNGMLGVILDGDTFQWYYDPEEISPEPSEVDASLDRITDQRIDDSLPEKTEVAFRKSVERNKELLQMLASDGCEPDPADDGPEICIMATLHRGDCSLGEATCWLEAFTQTERI